MASQSPPARPVGAFRKARKGLRGWAGWLPVVPARGCWRALSRRILEVPTGAGALAANLRVMSDYLWPLYGHA